jgi:hypothetical protein
MTNQPSPNRRGRPTRAQVSAPAAARVSACRALIDNERGEGDDAGGGSRINARAVAMMRRAN